MDKFLEEINKLSSKVDKSEIYPESNSINPPAIDLLFKFSEKGINELKSNGLGSVKLHRLPFDLVPLFFHFESSGEGFVISTAKKYTFFMQSADKKIFVFGKAKKIGQAVTVNDKMQQLFNIDFAENDGDVTFYDSTNKELKPDEIVLLALNWSLN